MQEGIQREVHGGRQGLDELLLGSSLGFSGLLPQNIKLYFYLSDGGKRRSDKKLIKAVSIKVSSCEGSTEVLSNTGVRTPKKRFVCSFQRPHWLVGKRHFCTLLVVHFRLFGFCQDVWKIPYWRLGQGHFFPFCAFLLVFFKGDRVDNVNLGDIKMIMLTMMMLMMMMSTTMMMLIMMLLMLKLILMLMLMLMIMMIMIIMMMYLSTSTLSTSWAANHILPLIALSLELAWCPM